LSILLVTTPPLAIYVLPVKASAAAATIGDKTESTQMAVGLRHSF
jgi:hypothetical protein